MTNQDPAAFTRRALDVEDYIDIARRHKGWIIGPAFAFTVLAVVIAYLWPDTYQSTAVIRVIPPQVPASLVAPNLTMTMQARITSLTETILSRATLTNIISTLGLYKKELSTHPMDDVVEQMRTKDIRISPVQTGVVTGQDRVTAFQISFLYNNRFQAQKVTNELVSRFITENLKNREEQSQGTTQFLSNEAADAKKKLDDAGQRLSDFRVRNMGHLPDQMEQNMQALNALQIQMTNVNAAISRVNQDKLLLENQLRIDKDRMAALKDPAQQPQVATAESQKLVDKDREIAAIESGLARLRERYKETHPDVQRAEAMLAQARTERAAIVQEQAKARPETRPVDPETVRQLRDLDERIRRTEAQIAAKNLEMDQHQKDLTQISASIGTYRSRIEGVPVGQKEYEQLLADRDLAEKQYMDLQGKMSSSQIATNLENRRQGEQLELLDPASLPQTPSEPKRYVIISVGAAVGLVVGLLIAGVREIKDTSLKNLKDVRAYTQLPILGSIPLLENDMVVKMRKRWSWMAWSTACLIGMLIMSGSVVYYYATRV
ncbi:MAG TPA: Wzz/FepE/Etk N-terminal domain-containing protein [Bryobacteraceae bacterium]|jgi:polysaccharide chain length determinant protein (PEP-CTERM system associated)|nr:Wzz/FepE/Etk N-terminal domain-containing protein [Bryobacteraceae bacterium]